MLLRVTIALGLLIYISGCAPSKPNYRAPNANEPIVFLIQEFEKEYFDNEYSGPTRFNRVVPEYIATFLKRDQITALIVDSVPQNSQAKFLIRGKIKAINEGTWALRFWIGFGAGAAKMEVESQLINLESGQSISTFKNSRVSTSYLQSESILRRLSKELASDITKTYKRHITP
jgi:hypothetical protein